jgi:hypothetical protein
LGTFVILTQSKDVYIIDDFSSVFLPLCVPVRVRGSYSSEGKCFEIMPSALSGASFATRCLTERQDEQFLDFTWGAISKVLRQ